MLDQNTDRMWYVIGAVIVGAAIIFLVNSSFPQLFASVGNTFTDKTSEISDTIGELTPGNNDYMTDANLLWGVGYENGYLNTDAANDGSRISSEEVGIPILHGSHVTYHQIKAVPNTTYRLSANGDTWYTRMVFYDSSNKYIEASYNPYDSSDHVFTSPANARFMRVSVDISYERTNQQSIMLEIVSGGE